VSGATRKDRGGGARDRYRRLGIPRRFKMHGHEITVRILPLSRWPHTKGALGLYDPKLHRIDVRSDQPDTAIQQTFSTPTRSSWTTSAACCIRL